MGLNQSPIPRTEILSMGKAGRGVMLTTHAHLMPWLRMSEAIFLTPPPLASMTWTRVTSFFYFPYILQTYFKLVVFRD